MDNNTLKLLDFSKGIRDKEVMYNFNLLFDLLSRERLSSAGFGLVEGLKIKYIYPDEERQRFKLVMDNGSYINLKGEEVQKTEQDIFLEFFNTVLISEEVISSDDGTIRLKEYPYVKDGWSLVEYDKERYIDKNIKVRFYDQSNNKEIEVKDIEGKTLTIDSRINEKVVIQYYTAKPRYDVLTFDNRDVIRYHKGIESESSSFFDTYKDELILAVVKYIPHSYPNKKDAKLEITQMSEISKRKIWIDQESGILYIGGVPFDGTQFISIEEPKDPFLNQFWYDMNTNQLKIWREIRGIEQWLVITDNSYMDSLKTKLWDIDNLPKDRQTFLFDPTKEQDLFFAEGTNSLEILIDNAPLMSDQYYEITRQDIENNIDIYSNIIPTDWMSLYLNEKHLEAKYFNQGVGFLLKEPLIQDAFVEAKVSHTSRVTHPQKRFERSGVFIDEKRLPVDTANNIYITDTSFLKDSNQLSVYLNGVKLTKDVDYKEIEVVESKGNIKNFCKSFVLNKKLQKDDNLTYRIIGNIMSYDDLSMYMEEVLEYYESAQEEKDILTSEINKLREELKKEKAIRNEEIKSIKEEIKNIKKSYNDLVTKDELSKAMQQKITNVQFIDQKISLAEIDSMKAINNYSYKIDTDKDYLTLNILTQLSTAQRNERVMLVKDLDYSLNGNTVIFLNTSLVDNSIGIHINGVAYSMEGVEI